MKVIIYIIYIALDKFKSVLIMFDISDVNFEKAKAYLKFRIL